MLHSFSRLRTNTLTRLPKAAFAADIRDVVEEDARKFNKELSRSMDVEFSSNEVTRRVRTRYAPSPTGLMHIGGLRTALYNYLFAKQHGGDFILRIEDTDKNREVEGSTEDIVNMMKWAGLDWQEGPGSDQLKTASGQSYYQSERLPIYHKYIKTLLEVSLLQTQGCRMAMLIRVSARLSDCKR